MSLISYDGRKAIGAYFLIGAASSVFWKFGVQIVLIEILSVIFTLHLFFNISFSRIDSRLNIHVRRSILLLCLWGFTQVFVDLYHGPDLLARIKTLASIITLICLLISGSYLFSSSYNKLQAFLVGYFLSSVPSFLLFPTEYARSQPWKFCFGLYATFLLFWIIGKIKLKPYFVVASLTFLVLFDLISNSRSLAVLTLITSCYTSYNKKLNRPMPVVSAFIITISILIAGIGSLSLASSGLLGTQVTQKTRMQSSSGPILLVARSEFLYEIETIRDKWLFGSGSNPKIDFSTLNKVWIAESELGINTKATSAYSTFVSTQTVPEHSMLFTTWVEGGVFAALFWIYLLIIFLKWFIWPLDPKHQLNFLCSMMLITGIWSILFSPLGTGSRLQIAVTLLVGQLCNSKILKSESQ